MTSKLENHLIVAGVHRSGTTTLFNRLARHPEVDASRIKETNYFLPARYGLRPRRRATRSNSGSIYREAHSRGVARLLLRRRSRIRSHPGVLPKTRVLVVLREPVERLESFYTFMKSILTVPRGMTSPSTSTRVWHLSPAELSSKELDMYRGLHDGLYADYYDAWRDSFGDRFRVYFLDDLSERPEETLADIAAWVGISPRAAARATRRGKP